MSKIFENISSEQYFNPKTKLKRVITKRVINIYVNVANYFTMFSVRHMALYSYGIQQFWIKYSSDSVITYFLDNLFSI